MGKSKKKKAHHAAAAAHVATSGEETPPVSASGNASQPPMPASVVAAGGGDAPPPVEAANGVDSSPMDSAAPAIPDGVPPSPPAVEASNGDQMPLDSEACANGAVPKAETESGVEVPEETRPEHEVEKLTTLNGMLVKQAVETRGVVTALTAQIDQRSADAGALADLELAVVRDALVAPLQAAAQDGTALRGHLADAQQTLQAAEARVARETDARAEAAARVEAAESEKLRAEELLRGKEAEAASASENVTQLEAAVDEQAGKSTELCAERGELEKQLGEVTASADRVHALKAEAEESFSYYRKNTEILKQEMEEKLEEKSKQLEGLRSSMEELEVKVRSLEAELSATLFRNRELEEEMGTSKTELDAARKEVEKLQSEAANASNKYTAMVTQVGHFRNEIAKMTTTKEADAAAFASEKTKLEKELDGLKRKVEKIQANKDAVMASLHQKDVEAAKLRAELNALDGTIAGQRALCDDLSGKYSSLQDENDAVLKALDKEKDQGDKLRLRLVELERYNADKDREIVVLKAQVENKQGQIASLNVKLKELHLAVDEAQHRGKSGAWTWLCPTTTVIAAASFAYAVRNR